MSLTDTTLQDAVATDDEGLQDSDGPDSITDGQETMETEPTEVHASQLYVKAAVTLIKNVFYMFVKFHQKNTGTKYCRRKIFLLV